MQVILKEKIRNLGDLGEIVHVKPGYARNFLIPQSKALFATKQNLLEFESKRAELEKIAAEKKTAAEQRAQKLAALNIIIEARAGEGGKLFGSIGTRDLAEAISAKGIEVGKHEVRLPEGVIRQIGEYDITLGLHSDVEIMLTIQVVAE